MNTDAFSASTGEKVAQPDEVSKIFLPRSAATRRIQLKSNSTESPGFNVATLAEISAAFAHGFLGQTIGGEKLHGESTDQRVLSFHQPAVCL